MNINKKETYANKYKIYAKAKARNIAIFELESKGTPFVTHFAKAYLGSTHRWATNNDIEHWAKEMWEFLRQARTIKLKQNNKRPSLDMFRDYFFYNGLEEDTVKPVLQGALSDLEKNEDEYFATYIIIEEDVVKKYNKFVDSLIEDSLETSKLAFIDRLKNILGFIE